MKRLFALLLLVGCSATTTSTLRFAATDLMVPATAVVGQPFTLSVAYDDPCPDTLESLTVEPTQARKLLVHLRQTRDPNRGCTAAITIVRIEKAVTLDAAGTWEVANVDEPDVVLARIAVTAP